MRVIGTLLVVALCATHVADAGRGRQSRNGNRSARSTSRLRTSSPRREKTPIPQVANTLSEEDFYAVFTKQFEKVLQSEPKKEQKALRVHRERIFTMAVKAENRDLNKVGNESKILEYIRNALKVRQDYTIYTRTFHQALGELYAVVSPEKENELHTQLYNQIVREKRKRSEWLGWLKAKIDENFTDSHQEEWKRLVVRMDELKKKIRTARCEAGALTEPDKIDKLNDLYRQEWYVRGGMQCITTIRRLEAEQAANPVSITPAKPSNEILKLAKGKYAWVKDTFPTGYEGYAEANAIHKKLMDSRVYVKAIKGEWACVKPDRGLSIKTGGWIPTATLEPLKTYGRLLTKIERAQRAAKRAQRAAERAQLIETARARAAERAHLVETYI